MRNRATLRVVERETEITIAAHADHCREDFVFPRTQSAKTRSMAWQSRLPPLRRTLLTIAANVAADVVVRIAS